MSRHSNARGEPILCYVTDRHILADKDPALAHETLLNKIATVAAAGVDWIQIREKDLSGNDCASLTRKALQRAATASTAGAAPTRILINDRIDVALSEYAGGVHLGRNSVPVEEAKRLANSRVAQKDFLLGVSCHSLEEAKAAESRGADYIFFGPVFATPSKADYGAPQGLQRLRETCGAIFVPVLAIGGVTLENAGACLAAGASGIAAIRLFQNAENAGALAMKLRTQKI